MYCVAFEGKSSVRRDNYKKAARFKQAMYLFQRFLLVCNMLEYFVHEDAIKRIVRIRIIRMRKSFVLANIERNTRMRLPGSLDSIGINIYSSRGSRPRIEQALRVAPVSTTIIEPIATVNVLRNTPQAILYIKRKGS